MNFTDLDRIGQAFDRAKRMKVRTRHSRCPMKTTLAITLLLLCGCIISPTPYSQGPYTEPVTTTHTRTTTTSTTSKTSRPVLS
jgi:hypothetical protein